MENLLDWIDYLIPLEHLARLSAAIGAGAVIGWEREKRDKPAGLRTHMLVSLGAALFMVGALDLIAETNDESSTITLDPLRVLAGIIGGIGFLGAGTIIQSRGSVQGVTTAAGIWVAAAVGTSCGMGQYRLAVLVVILSLIVLRVVGVLESRIVKPDDDVEKDDDAN